MSLIVPNAVVTTALQNLITPNLTIRLFGNAHTPIDADTVTAYTEIAGGGYAPISLTFTNWTVTPGSPITATYNTAVTWTFSGIINAPGSVYGYFVTKDSDGSLAWAEEFPSGVIPFSPVNGSIITVTPLITAASLF